MPEPFEFASAAPVLWSLIVHSVWKGTLLLAAAAVLARCLASRSAAARHLVWTTALAGLLALPALQLALPEWSVPLPHSLSAFVKPARSSPDVLRIGGAAGSPDIADAFDRRTAADFDGDSPADVTAIAAGPGPSLDASSSEPGIVGRIVRSIAAWSATNWLVAAWTLGLVIALARLAAGVVSLRRLERRADPASDPLLQSHVRDAAFILDLDRPVTLLISDARTIPMTWGVVRPRVLVPREALSWQPDRLRMVLLHELAHVQRYDCVSQWIGQLVRAVHWYNPLVWWGVRCLEVELERACDDRVLSAGAEPHDYAEQLLSITARLPASFFGSSAALAVGRAERIRRRLESILDDGRNRRSVPAATVRRLLACGLLLTAGMASAQWDTPSVGVAFVDGVQVRSPAGQLASTEPSGDLLADAAVAADAQAPAQPETVRPDQPPGAVGATLKTVTETRELIRSKYARNADERVLNEAAIKGMLQALNDPYTEFLPAEKLKELNRSLEGNLTGIGVQLTVEDDRLVVVTPLPDSPALRAGLKPKDAILAVDGKSVRELGQQGAPAAIRGPTGTTVRLRVRRALGAEEEITVTRAPLRLSPIQGISLLPDGNWQHWLDTDSKIAYLHITEFNNRTPEVVRTTLLALQGDGLKGLVLDLRHCPGGLLTAAVDVVRLFLAEGIIVTIRGLHQPEMVHRADGGTTLPPFPLVVLVNEQTASAAEIVAAALRENGRAVLLGTRTFGKGSVQSIHPVVDSGAVKLTSAFFHSPSGRMIDREPGGDRWGVDPNDGLYVPLSAESQAQWLKRRQERTILGGSGDKGTAAPARHTPASIETDLADPQLAAALRTMTARLAGGEFLKVGKSEADLQAHTARVEKLRRDREETLKKLQQIDRELSTAER